MTERQQVDAGHQLCEHGRNAFIDDCGMCDRAGTNWALVPSKMTPQVTAMTVCDNCNQPMRPVGQPCIQCGYSERIGP